MVEKKLIRILLTALVCFVVSAGMSFAGSDGQLIPNIIDNQPIATDDCVLTNHSTTEAPNGQSIGVRNYGCVLNGRNVVFTVSIPKLCETTSCGLIVDQHGATMNAAQQNAGTKLREYGWKAMQRGASTPYVVIQPNMTDLFDNATHTLDPISVMGGAYDNELPILMLFVQNAISALNIDQTRVHVHGFSRGAQTANALYCDPATKSIFASYVATGGAINCALDKPVMMINGLTDPNVLSANSVVDGFKDSGTTSELLAQDPNW
ncbi:MAG: hypothetical protein NTW65_08670, partial [Deltaproteobacteria bacterium]|nr:hypothetical protein [Deltaproteobacteria bacterium]